MANFFENLVGKIFGNKHEKDVSALQPIVAEVNAVYEQLKSLTNDELRAKTAEFKLRIKEYTDAIDDQIQNLDEQVRNDESLDLEEKEAAYNDIDKLKKERDKKLEEAMLYLISAFLLMEGCKDWPT